MPGYLRARYGVPHDIDGPRVRLGFVWLLAVGLALTVGIAGVAALFVVVCGFAAHQIAQAWAKRGIEADPWVAAGGAVLMVAAGGVDLRWVGLALLAVVAAAVGVAQLNARRQASIVVDAAHTVLAAGVVGLAGACVVTCLRYDDLGAAAVLVAFTLAYDAGDFLVGTGAAHPIEGPVAGWLALASVATVVAVLQVPPFRGVDTWIFAALAAVACPLGQIAASAVLPSADSNAPALRRIDSLLVLAPAFTYAVGIFLQHHH